MGFFSQGEGVVPAIVIGGGVLVAAVAMVVVAMVTDIVIVVNYDDRTCPGPVLVVLPDLVIVLVMVPEGCTVSGARGWCLDLSVSGPLGHRARARENGDRVRGCRRASAHA